MNNTHRKYIAGWFWTGAGLIFLMLIVGGITRLTGSGLSMTDWNLIMGALPPMSPAEWKEIFEQYKQFPEYQQLNNGMSLGEFKGIFFWEYLHRILGRLTGIVFLIPFLWFWLRGYFTPRLLKRTLILFGLGAIQAAMGWIMVQSGLVDNPYVSHYRLAAHLILAFVLIGFCVWYALDLRQRTMNSISATEFYNLRKWGLAVAGIFLLQVFWGALTAGLDAGLIYNTFPLMNENWLPRNSMSLHPLLINFVENPGMVQWIHRVLGTILAVAVMILWFQAKPISKGRSTKFFTAFLVGIVLIQYVLGILTLLYHVPVVLGVFHQAVAMLFWIAWLIFYHTLKEEADQRVTIS